MRHSILSVFAEAKKSLMRMGSSFGKSDMKEDGRNIVGSALDCGTPSGLEGGLVHAREALKDDKGGSSGRET